jgi:hypothetical protein
VIEGVAGDPLASSLRAEPFACRRRVMKPLSPPDVAGGVVIGVVRAGLAD